MRYVLLLLLMVFLSGCSARYVPTNVTPKGYVNYIESNKRIKKEKKAIEKHHKKERKRIKRLQSSDRDVWDR